MTTPSEQATGFPAKPEGFAQVEQTSGFSVVADLEADGLLREATVIHCLCCHVLETGETFSFADQPGYLPISEGLALLQAADFVIGHNFAEYDARVIAKLRGVALDPDRILDTLRMSRSLVDLKEMARWDRELHESGRMPLDCVGKKSLKSWGFRLRQPKNAFGETTDWKRFSHDMVRYCRDDVLLNVEVYRVFERLIEEEGRVPADQANSVVSPLRVR